MNTEKENFSQREKKKKKQVRKKDSSSNFEAFFFFFYRNRGNSKDYQTKTSHFPKHFRRFMKNKDNSISIT